MKNIKYSTEELKRFYSVNRVSWDDIYPSEKHIFTKSFTGKELTILDVGCACGGMGKAIEEQFKVQSYTGIEINKSCVEMAPSIFPKGQYFYGDFLELSPVIEQQYNTVLSMSCADWNIETKQMINKMFEKVEDMGEFIFSCRLTNSNKDYIAEQYLNFENSDKAATHEIAPYKVFCFESLMKMIFELSNIAQVNAYGYWGLVPKSVVALDVREVFYTVISVKKDLTAKPPQIMLEGFEGFWRRSN